MIRACCHRSSLAKVHGSITAKRSQKDSQWNGIYPNSPPTKKSVYPCSRERHSRAVVWNAVGVIFMPRGYTINSCLFIKVTQSQYKPGQAQRTQEFEAHRLQDFRQKKVGRLSALRTDRLYPQRNIPGTHFC